MVKRHNHPVKLFFIVFRGYYLKVWDILTVNSIWPCPAEKAIIRQRVKLEPQWDTVCLSLIKGSHLSCLMLHFAFLRSRNRKLVNLFGVEFGLCLPPICLFYIMRQGPMHPRLVFYIVEDSLELLVLCLFLSNTGVSGICLYHALLPSLPGHMEITGRCPWYENQ